MKLLTIIFLLCYCYAFSQHNPTPHFVNFGTEHGLPRPEVYCVFEDSKGYMWFGTDNGVSRFDGYEFRNYGNKDGLLGNVIFYIFEDEHGILWFGSMTKKVFQLENDSIIPYKFNHILDKYNGKFSVLGMVYSKSTSTVYFELRDLGILSIDNLGGDSLYTTKIPFSTIALDFKHLPRLSQSQTHNTSDRTEYIKFLDNGKFHVNIITDSSSTNKLISGLGTSNVNLIYKRKQKDHYFHFRPNQISTIKNNELSYLMPFPFPGSVEEDDTGKLWIGLLNGKGLRCYNTFDDLYTSKFDLYLEGISVSDSYIDSRGALWLTSLEKGVFYSADPELQSYNTQFGFNDELVQAISIKDEDELFLRCSNGDIYHLNIA